MFLRDLRVGFKWDYQQFKGRGWCSPNRIMAGMVYDPDAFDSMAVINAEQWNTGGVDGPKLTRADILPQVRKTCCSSAKNQNPHTHTQGVSGLSRRELEEAILSAAEHGATEVVQELHTHCGHDIINTTDSDQYTPLHRASYNGHTDTVEYLISNGARVDARTVDGWQPLHSACRWNNTAVADLLLQNGALVNAQTHGKQTPLHLAASNDRARETLILLLAHPALQPHLVNGQGDTALEVAERSGRFAGLFVMAEDSVDYRKYLLPNLTSEQPPS